MIFLHLQKFAWVISLGLAFTLGGCTNFLFFQPDSEIYYDPAQFGLWHESVVFDSQDGTRLSGWFLPAKGKPRGTVVLFHGNGANITNHVAAIRWMPPQGFSVFLFDYRGYGESQGRPTRRGAVEDGAAAIRYVRSRKDVDSDKLIIYGQSLGGALAFNALAMAGTEGVRALVVEGTFASYKDVVWKTLSNTWGQKIIFYVLYPLYLIYQYPTYFTYPLVYPIPYLPLTYFLFQDSDHPLEVMDAIKEIPLLVIHGEQDRTVPFSAGKELFDAFPGMDKTFWAVPYADHQTIFSKRGSPWRGRLTDYFHEKLPAPPTPPRAYNPPEPHVKW